MQIFTVQIPSSIVGVDEGKKTSEVADCIASERSGKKLKLLSCVN